MPSYDYICLLMFISELQQICTNPTNFSYNFVKSMHRITTPGTHLTLQRFPFVLLKYHQHRSILKNFKKPNKRASIIEDIQPLKKHILLLVLNTSV